MTDLCAHCGKVRQDVEVYSLFDKNGSPMIAYLCEDCWVIVYGKGKVFKQRTDIL